MTEERVYNAGDAIRFTAQVAKVSTLADGGIRVTLDLPETAIDTATKLMQVKQRGGLLEVAALPVLQTLTNGETKTNERAETSPIDLAGG